MHLTTERSHAWTVTWTCKQVIIIETRPTNMKSLKSYIRFIEWSHYWWTSVTFKVILAIATSFNFIVCQTKAHKLARMHLLANRKTYTGYNLPRDAMHKRGLCRHAVSVCLSDMFVSCVKTNKHIIKLFSPSGSHTILVFTWQTGWR